MSFTYSLSLGLVAPLLLFYLLKRAPALAGRKTRRQKLLPELRPGAGVLAAVLCPVTCAAAQDPPPASGSEADAVAVPASSVVVITSSSVTGFETPGAWSATSSTSVSGFNVELTTNRTQGHEAYAVGGPPPLFKLVSHTISSTTSALTGIGNSGALIQLDVLAPSKPEVTTKEQQGNCEAGNDGWISGYVSSRSLGLDSVSLGKVSFGKYRACIYNTISFTLPESVTSVLAKKTPATWFSSSMSAHPVPSRVHTFSITCVSTLSSSFRRPKALLLRLDMEPRLICV